MDPNKIIVVPVSFINEASANVLAVDEAGFRKMMGYDQRSESAAKSASWAFRAKFGIRTLPGGVYYIEEIKRALDQEYRLEQEKRLRRRIRERGY